MARTKNFVDQHHETASTNTIAQHTLALLHDVQRQLARFESAAKQGARLADGNGLEACIRFLYDAQDLLTVLVRNHLDVGE